MSKQNEPRRDCGFFKFDNECLALREVYCKNGECKFYKPAKDVDHKEIETKCKLYAATHSGM